MLIKQEETSPICDWYDSHHLSSMFREIEKQSGDRVVDTMLLKTYLDETQKVMKDFGNYIDQVEKKLEKQDAQAQFREKIYGKDSLGG